MPDTDAHDDAHVAGAHLPPGRYEELLPRLNALLTDFAELETLDVAEVEPLPSFAVAEANHDGD